MSLPQRYRDQPVPVDGRSGNERVGGERVDHPTDEPTETARGKVPRSRIGEVWVAAVAFAVVLLVLLIFVLENGQLAEVSFFGTHGHLPMGVALLLAAVFGVLLVALPGTARIIQLRLLDRRRPAAAPIPLDEVNTAPPRDAGGTPR